MPLTHVCISRRGKVERVGVNDIGRMRYERHHLFCNLCGQPVSYVSETYDRCAFFRHSPNPGKTCDEKDGSSWSTPLRQRDTSIDFFVRLNPERLNADIPSIVIDMVIPPVSEQVRKIWADGKYRQACGIG